jgi:hypothetical protein
MSRSKDYIGRLLDGIPKWDLPLVEHREAFSSIQDKLLSAEDITSELKNLYTVREYSDFALSLLWIADKVERNPALVDATEDEQSLVLNMFRRAVDVSLRDLVSDSPFVADTDSKEDGIPAQVAGEPPSLTQTEIPLTLDASFGGDPTEFGKLFDKLTEAVQTGSDTRLNHIARIIQECKIVAAGDFPSEYKQLGEILSEFLEYVTSNQFLDDIRVMNLVQNVQDPISQWSNADPSNREGILTQALQVLQDYKQMFE